MVRKLLFLFHWAKRDDRYRIFPADQKTGVTIAAKRNRGNGVKTVVRCLFVSIGLVALFSCDLVGAAKIPSEIHGTWEYRWSMSATVQYIETFEIDSDSISYTGYSPSYPGTAYYTCSVEWVDKATKTIKTTNDMYFVWHLDGGFLYLKKTNPGADRPEPADDWWVAGYSYKLTKK